jgi:hypothetical protein
VLACEPAIGTTAGQRGRDAPRMDAFVAPAGAHATRDRKKGRSGRDGRARGRQVSCAASQSEATRGS